MRDYACVVGLSMRPPRSCALSRWAEAMRRFEDAAGLRALICGITSRSAVVLSPLLRQLSIQMASPGSACPVTCSCGHRGAGAFMKVVEAGTPRMPIVDFSTALSAMEDYRAMKSSKTVNYMQVVTGHWLTMAFRVLTVSQDAVKVFFVPTLTADLTTAVHLLARGVSQPAVRPPKAGDSGERDRSRQPPGGCCRRQGGPPRVGEGAAP